MKLVKFLIPLSTSKASGKLRIRNKVDMNYGGRKRRRFSAISNFLWVRRRHEDSNQAGMHRRAYSR